MPVRKVDKVNGRTAGHHLWITAYRPFRIVGRAILPMWQGPVHRSVCFHPVEPSTHLPVVGYTNIRSQPVDKIVNFLVVCLQCSPLEHVVFPKCWIVAILFRRQRQPKHLRKKLFAVRTVTETVIITAIVPSLIAAHVKENPVKIVRRE